MKPTELNETIRKTVETLANETDAARQSELFKDYLRAASLFWSYSFGNCLLIWSQRPTATRVAGYRTWQKLNRYVRKGEKAIHILAPMVFRDKRQADADGLVTEERQRIWFKPVCVFDLAQTDGQPLPDLPQTYAGDPGALESSLLALAAAHGIVVEFGSTGDANGFSEEGGKHIVVSEALNPAGRASVLVHELAHSLLHFNKDRKVNLRQRELEAESVAYVVGSHFGLETRADMYLASYGVKAADLLESLPIIQKTAAEIIRAIEGDSKAAVESDEPALAACA